MRREPLLLLQLATVHVWLGGSRSDPVLLRPHPWQVHSWTCHSFFVSFPFKAVWFVCQAVWFVTPKNPSHQVFSKQECICRSIWEVGNALEKGELAPFTFHAGREHPICQHERTQDPQNAVL